MLSHGQLLAEQETAATTLLVAPKCTKLLDFEAREVIWSSIWVLRGLSGGRRVVGRGVSGAEFDREGEWSGLFNGYLGLARCSWPRSTRISASQTPREA